MGLISSNLDDEYEKAKPVAAKVDPGVYNMTITKLEIVTEREKIREPWIDVLLVISLEDEETGGKAWHRLELMPLTTKDGVPSPGKLGFVKGQLENMGYTGKFSDFEYHVNELQGAKVRVEVKDTPDRNGRKNPKTGNVYTNRECYIQELLAPGVGGSAGGGSVSSEFVAPPADDDDIPF